MLKTSGVSKVLKYQGFAGSQRSAPFLISAVFSVSYIRVIKSGGVSAKLNHEECSRKVGLHYSYNYCTNIRLQLFP